MNNILRTFILTAAVSAGSLLSAQVTTAKATIPFAFHVQNTVLPAGTYTVLEDHVFAAATMMLRDREGHSIAVMAPRILSSGDKSARLVFNRYGDSYCLSQVWGYGEDAGRHVATGKYERELRAAKSAPEETVVLMLRASR